MGNTHQQLRLLRPGATWTDDNSERSCNSCEKPFRVVVRPRHHCRVCGGVFCAECCPEKPSAFGLPLCSMTPEQRVSRHCRSCRLPLWLLPLHVIRHVGRRSWRVVLDGQIVQTIISFLSTNRDRSRLIYVHPLVRKWVCIPNLPFRDSVQAVFSGIRTHYDNFASTDSPPNNEIGQIGRGGYGAVFQAYRHEALTRVAVKILLKLRPKSSTPSYDSMVGQIEREVAIHRMLTERGGGQHRIVPFIDAFQTVNCVVLELSSVQGCTARTASREVRHAASDVAHRIDVAILTLIAIRDTATALAFMAEHSLVHRDVKLENVVFTRDYLIANLIDFGLATTWATEDRAAYPVRGTLGYLSPEQLGALAGGSELFGATPAELMACDVYSLGVMAYKMLTKRRPHTAATTLRLGSPEYWTTRYNATREAASFDDFKFIIPMELQKLVASMLAFEPSQRPTFAAILAHPALLAPQDGGWFDVMGMCARRRARLEAEEQAMRDLWDFCDDIYDKDGDEVDASRDRATVAHGSHAAAVLSLRRYSGVPPTQTHLGASRRNGRAAPNRQQNAKCDRDGSRSTTITLTALSACCDEGRESDAEEELERHSRHACCYDEGRESDPDEELDVRDAASIRAPQT